MCRKLEFLLRQRRWEVVILPSIWLSWREDGLARRCRRTVSRVECFRWRGNCWHWCRIEYDFCQRSSNGLGELQFSVPDFDDGDFCGGNAYNLLEIVYDCQTIVWGEYCREGYLQAYKYHPYLSSSSQHIHRLRLVCKSKEYYHPNYSFPIYSLKIQRHEPQNNNLETRDAESYSASQ